MTEASEQVNNARSANSMKVVLKSSSVMPWVRQNCRSPWHQIAQIGASTGSGVGPCLFLGLLTTPFVLS